MENTLRELILSEIRSKGPIPFERFMELALYAPNMGYYLREGSTIGRGGDFFTASHLGNVFGSILSRPIEEVWRRMGEPKDFHIVEIGPGMGHLAYDILTALQGNPIESCLSYHLVELNPHLVKLQKKRLENFLSKVFWWRDIFELEHLSGVIICNEILDAFPVRLFEVRDSRILEVYVGTDRDGEFVETFYPADNELISYLEEFAPWVQHFDNYRSEACLRIRNWLRTLRGLLKGGLVLLIDYGYLSEEYYDLSRNRGTLMCYFKHTTNDVPYVHIGEQDITAHVNFTAVAKWAEEAGFKVENYTTQYRYLFSLVDEKFLERLYNHNPSSVIQFKTLILPGGMGESHKVMTLSVGL
ncbi:MAG: SAM-dependent methyltransferase [Syntrophobacterales bacterium]|nr:SAM-dependent methyltransferase [Syntrophobacterales bacterium]